MTNVQTYPPKNSIDEHTNVMKFPPFISFVQYAKIVPTPNALRIFKYIILLKLSETISLMAPNCTIQTAASATTVPIAAPDAPVLELI